MFQEILDRVGDVEILAEPTWMCAGPDQSVGVSIDTLPVRLAAK